MKPALFIVAVAFVLRLVAVFTLGALPISRTPQLDSLEYLLWAQRIAAGVLDWPAYPEHAPGYPLFLGVVLMVTGGSLTAVRIVQSVLGALTCVLTARIAGRTLTAKAYLPAGLLQAAYAPFIYLDTALLAEPLFIFLVMLSIDLATRAALSARVEGRLGKKSRAATGSTTTWLWAGVAAGAASIVRPTGLVIVAAIVVAWWWQTRDTRATWRPVRMFAVGALIVIAPVVVQNWRVTGIPLIQAYGGMNVYLGNTPSSDGAARARLGGSWDALEGEATRAGATRNEQDRYFLRRTLAEIAASPAGYVGLLTNKLAWTTQQEELRDTHSYYFFRDALPLLIWLPGFGLVIAAAAIGVAAGRRRASAPIWVALPLLALLATVLFLVVGFRYRAPLVPLLAALGGAGLAWLIEDLRTRNVRRAAGAVAVFAAVIVMSNVRSDAASRNVAEEWAFTGLSLLREGDVAVAEDAYRRAIALDDGSSYAWDGLGLALQRKGEAGAGRTAFERAVQINPTNAVAWYHVGIARDQSGDREGAILAYRQALAITPERTDYIASLGGALHAQGRRTEAEPLLRTAADRGDGSARLALAAMAMERGDAARALAEAREAARLMPASGRAWELLARAAIASRQVREAEQALLQAERLGLDRREAARMRQVLALLR